MQKNIRVLVVLILTIVLSFLASALYALSPAFKYIFTNPADPTFSDPKATELKLSELKDSSFFLKGTKEELLLVSLTFDDGPDGTVTPQIINILNKYKVKGNFFFIGKKVLAYPGIVRQAYYDGHLVSNHSYEHPSFDGKSVKFARNDFAKADQAFEAVIGKHPILFRPPYGILTNNVLEVSKETGVSIIAWSVDTLDWAVKDTKAIASSVLDNVSPGDIILMHSIESNQATVQALPEIIEGLQTKGYQIVTLDRLLDIEPYN